MHRPQWDIVMRLLSESEVAKLVTPEMAIESAEQAFVATSGGAAQVPTRMEIYRTNPDGRSLIMPGYIGKEIFGVKIGGYVIDVDGTGRRLSTGMIVIWNAKTLTPRGLIASDLLNEHRTAAGMAVATRLLAKPQCETHALFGAGKLSLTAALYIAHVRPHARLLIVSRTQSRVDALADKLSRMPTFARTQIITGYSPAAAAAEADIITAVTTSAEPLFDGTQVRKGTHLNLGGANYRQKREVDDAVARRSHFYLDSNDGCRAGAGDLVVPLESGVITEDQIKGEIGAVLLKKIPGRIDDDEITVFKSMGIAAQDLCLGSALLEKAEAAGAGVRFNLHTG